MAVLRFMSETRSPTDAPFYLNFGWTRAILQECIIVVAINGSIAWFVFRGRQDIVWLGWAGIFSFLFPMSLMLPFFTTFFGYMIGSGYRKLQSTALPSAAAGKWWWRAIAIGLLHAFIASIFTYTSLSFANKLWPQSQFNHLQAVGIVCVVSIVFASIFHSRSIFKGMSA